MNCDSANICIKNQSRLYNQLINILNLFIEKNKTNAKIDYSDIENNFIKEFCC